MISEPDRRIELDRARVRTDELFALLRPGSLYERPVAERHRLIFYIGHVEAFDWNKICRGALDLPSFDPEFDRLFEAGIDPEPGKLPSDQPSDWPSEEEVRAYNAKLRERIDRVLDQSPEDLFQMAIEHRLMHAETLAYLLHNLPYDHKVSREADRSLTVAAQNGFRDIPAGTATLGRKRGEDFGWDNEYEEQKRDVPAFAIAKHKVSNGEYLEFVRAGAPAPHFWIARAGEWHYRGMFGEIPLPLVWPVYVTQQEAAAYAAWRGKSLPTEAQFHRAAYATPEGGERSYPWGECEPAATQGNFDFHGWEPASVDATPGGDSAFGVSQLCGNGWEWTSSVFAPFDGFREAAAYPGYSANFFDGQHYVLKGASPRTAGRFLRRSFRNWFRKEYPYLYASFRCVEN